MSDLFNDAAGLWSAFGHWYTQIFGEGGLLNSELLQVQDGQTTLDEVHITVRGGPDDYIATDLLRDLPDKLNALGDWINQKYGAIIIS